MGVSDPEIQKKIFGPRWQHEVENKVGRSGKGSSIACKVARFASPKRKIEKVNEVLNRTGRLGRLSARIWHQQPSRRRTTTASPSKPVPKRLSVPGSGTTEVAVVANPVREQPSRTPK